MDRISHGRVTDSVIATGTGAHSRRREDRDPSVDRETTNRSKEQGRAAAAKKGPNVDGQVIAVGRGARASRKGTD